MTGLIENVSLSVKNSFQVHLLNVLYDEKSFGENQKTSSYRDCYDLQVCRQVFGRTVLVIT